MYKQAPKIQVFAKETLALNGIIDGLDLSGLVPLYLHVSQNLKTINRDRILSFNVGDSAFMYQVDADNNIHLITGRGSGKNAKDTKYQIRTSEHFWVELLKDGFDLSGLIPLYIEATTNPQIVGEKVEFSIGRATYIYSVDENSVIHVITGWPGNRHGYKHRNKQAA